MLNLVVSFRIQKSKISGKIYRLGGGSELYYWSPHFLGKIYNESLTSLNFIFTKSQNPDICNHVMKVGDMDHESLY